MNDPNARPTDKYEVVKDGVTGTTNIGYPGYTNAAIAEVYRSGVVPTMCAQAATGQLTPEEALDQADRQVGLIFDKWKASGKI
jgi:multiple sugar transport system substrate-binding protein